MIMQIERRWGRDPGWLLSLPPETQAAVIADWNLEQEEAKVERLRREAAARGGGRG